MDLKKKKKCQLIVASFFINVINAVKSSSRNPETAVYIAVTEQINVHPNKLDKMSKNKVKNLYAIGSAKWYDFFKPGWNWLVSRKAEKKFSLFLKKNLDKNTSILELGCGTALNLQKIKSLNLSYKNYLGLDFSEDMLKIARSKFKGHSNIMFKHKDLTQLDDAGEKYDIIICTWVLSHIHYPAEVINQAQLLLNSNGKMFLIFLSKPKWYVNFWFNPIAKYLFRSKYVSVDEIKKIQNIKSVEHFSSDIVTTIEINK